MRATISLVCIAKNERNNIDRWYKSVEGCVDEIIFCDTGSSDGTQDRARELGLKVVNFPWCDDFSKARNFANEFATSDYVFWTDLDDTLSDKQAFISWRDKAMHLSDYWLATYHYAFDHNNNPACSFVRERVWKRSLGLKWSYFIHEGVVPQSTRPVRADFVKTWAIHHNRTLEDLLKDKGRNLNIFRKHNKESFDSRMLYYYGKELFEAGEAVEAYKTLSVAAAKPDLQLHDRILCIQYAISAFQKAGEMEKSLQMARFGMELAPQRAEFWIMAGDAYFAMKQIENAIPFYSGARTCRNEGMSPTGFVGLIFTTPDAYGVYPTNQLGRCYCMLGNFDKAEEILSSIPGNQETKLLLDEVKRIKASMFSIKEAKDCDDIVFTCPGGLYEWDWDGMKERGYGGSETACIQMAHHLKALTGKKVKVFNIRQQNKVCSDGVEYLNIQAEAVHYFKDYKPKLHVAWRHNMKFTDGKTVVWAHDLIAPGMENVAQYDKFLTLSEFHKDYVTGLHGLPAEKVHVTRNGIDLKKFPEPTTKNPHKIIWPSSPDRGLEKVIQVLDVVRETFPVELHVFYGFNNMRQMGVDTSLFDSLIKDRPWIKVHGNLEHSKLLEQYKDAALWVYPTDFLETFCINALETVKMGVYPIVRNWGALPCTLKGLPATLVEKECVTQSQVQEWAHEVVKAIKERIWDRIVPEQFIGEHYDWQAVAKEWLLMLE